MAAQRPYEPIRRVDDEGQIPEIEMFVGESRVFATPGVARIAVGNGALLTAAALDNKEVIVFANAVGTSSLFIWNAAGVWLLLLATIERMKQMSSAQPARWGNRLLTHAPDWPCWRKS